MDEDFLGGTLAPAFLASERPIAIACLRLVTFRPERPERRVPRLRSRIARSILRLAFFPYLRVLLLAIAVPPERSGASPLPLV